MIYIFVMSMINIPNMSWCSVKLRIIDFYKVPYLLRGHWRSIRV